MPQARFALLLLAAAALSSALDTPCQQCCAPGGDCSKAYKGTPGKCCGTLGGQAFCCPGVTYRGANSGDAKCYNCGSTYRCFTGASTHNICGTTPGAHHAHHPSEWRRHDPRLHYAHREDDRTSTGVLVLFAVLCVLLILFCARRQHDTAQMYSPNAYAAVGHPVMGVDGKPMMMAAPAQPMHQMGAPGCGAPYGMAGYGGYGGGGYSGMAVAGSAAAGFVGGMMVSEAMDAGHHHQHGHSDAGYYGGGGDYGGGGGYGGGGYEGGGYDSGGGGDFAADS